MSTVSLLPAGEQAAGTDRLRLAAAAYLARFTGPCRMHTESDLRAYLAWCAERGVDPLAVERAQVELYVRWMQEVRRFKPSTVSRRMSVVAGFYRTVSSTACWPARPPSMCAGRRCRTTRPPSG